MFGKQSIDCFILPVNNTFLPNQFWFEFIQGLKFRLVSKSENLALLDTNSDEGSKVLEYEYQLINIRLIFIKESRGSNQ